MKHPKELKERTLHVEALSWIRVCLAESSMRLSELARALPLDAGHVTTFLPDGISDSRALDFRSGGLLPSPPPNSHVVSSMPDGLGTRMVPIPNMNSYVARMAKTWMAGTSRVCVLENRLARTGDAWLETVDVRVITLRDEVYHILFDGDDEDFIEQTLSIAGAPFPPLVGVLSTNGIAVNVRTFADDMLKRIVARAEKLIVGAYDGEGFLIWHRE